MIQPTAGQQLRGSLPITVRINGNRPNVRADFYSDETLIGTVNRSDCGSSCDLTYNWPTGGVSNGSHGIWARGFNGDWGAPSARINVTVDNAAPTIQLSLPPNGGLFIDPIPLQATATAGPSGIHRVEFFARVQTQPPVLIGTATAQPYNITWAGNPTCIAQEADGPQDCRYTITATVYNNALDSSGQRASVSSNEVLAIDGNGIIRGADRIVKDAASFGGNLEPGNLQYTNAVNAFLGVASTRLPVAINMYERVLRTFPSHTRVLTTVKTHLITAVTRLSEGYILTGNQRFVDALTGPGGGYRSLDLSDAIDKLTAARQNHSTALDTYVARFTSTLPAPHNNYWTIIRNEQATHCDNYDSAHSGGTISEEETYFPTCAPNIPNPPARTNYWDWRLMGKASGRKAFATRELVQKRWARNSTEQHDQDEAANLLAIAEIEAIGEMAFYQSVITDTIPARTKEKIFSTWRDLITEKNELSRAIRYMSEGRNFLGFKRQYVQFLPPRNPDDHRTNFERHLDLATSTSALASNSLGTLREAARRFEASASSYLGAQAANQSHFGDALSRLCGSQYQSRCDSGDVGIQFTNIAIAQNKVEQVEKEIDNAQVRYQAAVRDRDEEDFIRQHTIRYVLDGIYRQESLIDSETQLRLEAEQQGGFMSLVSGLVAGIVATVATEGIGAAALAASAGSIMSGLGSLIGGSSRAERQGAIDRQRVRLQALEKAEIMRADGQLADLRYRTLILNTRLEREKLAIDLKGAMLVYDREVQQLANYLDQVNRAFTERENWRLLNEVQSNNFSRDPTVRMFRDTALDGYTRDQYNALGTAYGAALALIYDMNKYSANQAIHWGPADCGPGCIPEIENPDDLLKMLTPDRLPAALATLTRIWNFFNQGAGRAKEIDVTTRLSWLLGIRAENPRDAALQLRAYLRANSTPDGLNVRLTFPTNIAVPLRPEEQPEFGPVLGPYWANVEIQSVQAFVLGGRDWREFHTPFRLFLSYGLETDRGDPLPVVGYMRRPDANIDYRSAVSDQINYYFFDSVGTATVGAGTGSSFPAEWGPPNFKFLDRPLGLDTWGLRICLASGCQADPTLIRSIDEIEEIYFRFTCKGITLN